MKQILMILFILTGFVFGQTEFNPVFDYAVFRYDDNSNLCEFYYSFPVNKMGIKQNGDSLYVSGGLYISLSEVNENGASIFSDSLYFNQTVDTLGSNDLNGLLTFVLPHGEYQLSASGIDINTTTISELYSARVISPDYPDSTFSLSDIELASDIIQFSEDTTSIFYKNKLEVFPNPAGIYGNDAKVVYFYYEIYGLNNTKVKSVYNIDQSLVSTNGKVANNKSKLVSNISSSRVDIGSFNIDEKYTGAYLLNVTVTDTVTGKTDYKSRKIFVYNIDKIDTTELFADYSDIAATEFSNLYNDELDYIFEYSKYLANQNEIDKWESIVTEEGKRTFLKEFWEKRDPDRSTPENEFRTEYLKRLEYVNDTFGNMIVKKGYKTDQGRVYLVYGAPDDISRYPNESEKKPYEIWRYDYIENGVFFVFVDWNSLGNYSQVHSTKRGEIYNPNWNSQISVY